MRIRFASYLMIAVVSAFLIVGSYAFAAGTYVWLAFAGGIVLALLGYIEVVTSRRRPRVAAPAALVAVLGVAMVIVAIALDDPTVADTVFGLSIATGVLSALGLAAHEMDVEHDLHELGMPGPALS
jgi:peptidoglycan/LPS O-acetylase OafA/YrhL